MNFVILLIPALIVCFIMKYMYDKHISTKEWLIHIGACVLGAIIVFTASYAISYSGLHDTEILNGQVTNKTWHKEICTEYSSCENYHWKEKCHYYRDSKGKRKKSCTSYKVFHYPFEIDWYVDSTVGDYKISRVNEQGTLTPPRWSAVKKGDYAAATNSYTNYLFADKDSLFSPEQLLEMYKKEYLDSLPVYPGISDYYKTYHVINRTKVNVDGFDDYIKDVLRTMGKEKQVNIQVLVYDYKDSDFVDATLGVWRGGKKNDVIMFFGVDETGLVKMFNSTSFAKGMKNEELHSLMRMDALNENLTLDLLKKEVHNIQTKFSRLSNSEFEYLSVKMEPRKEVLILAAIILAVISIFVGIFMRNNEL